MTTALARTCALGAAAILALSACAEASPSASTSPVPTTPSTEAPVSMSTLDQVTWTESDAGVPTLEFTAPFHIESSSAALINDGDGELIEAGDSVTVEYTVTSGNDGTQLYSTYDAGMPETLSLADGLLDPVLVDVLVGASTGADVLYAVVDVMSADPAGAETVMMAMTVTARSTVLERAEGTQVESVDGPVEVTLADNGAPSISLPEGDEATEFVAQTLIEGAGDPVGENATITAHYTGWLWNGEQFDSSWERGSTLTISLAPGGVIEGWTQGLVGQPVGSQVLLIIPAELGYGDMGSGTIPPGATLIFVVDILAAS